MGMIGGDIRETFLSSSCVLRSAPYQAPVTVIETNEQARITVRALFVVVISCFGKCYVYTLVRIWELNYCQVKVP